MGDLFWNKVAGVFLAVILVILGLRTLGHELIHADSPSALAYPVDLAAMSSAAPAEEEPEGPVDFGALLASADISAGERVARRCASCHNFEAGEPNKVGPALYGVMGRDVATLDGFSYSGAMESYAQGGTEWMYQNVYDYLENPSRYISGTAMSFAGLRDQEDRINLIAYMRSQDDNPLALPAPLSGSGETSEASAEPDMTVQPG
jgi:cytochrome c